MMDLFGNVIFLNVNSDQYQFFITIYILSTLLIFAFESQVADVPKLCNDYM
jgi:hypothetical protein